MESVTLNCGKQPKVRLLSIGGDLRLSGRESEQLEAKAPTGEKLIAEQKDEWIEIKSYSDCLIFLPREAHIEGDTVGSDLRATNVMGGVMIRMVGGDVSLRGVGQASFETVGGDLHARKVTGDLSFDRIGGDAIIDRVSGDVRLRSVGGDLSVQRIDGLLEAAAGGDVSLLLTTLAGQLVKVSAGGDLSSRLPTDASARVQLNAGGDISYPKAFEVQRAGSNVTFQLGEGEVEVQLNAGGDLWLQCGEEAGEMDYSDFGSTLAAQIESEVEAGIAEMEARLQALDMGLKTFDSDRVGERVRRAFSRARRKAERAHRKADYARRKVEHRASGRRGRMDMDFRTSAKPKQEVSDEERLTILRMLEKGTITVEEAEKLLQAMEGGE